jgi:hypothetical protein
MQNTFLAAAGALLWVAGPARAVTVSGGIVSGGPDTSAYVVSAGAFAGDYSGAGVIEGCAGALRWTAARCAADRIEPPYDGQTDSPNNVVLFTLAGSAPSKTAQYQRRQGDALYQTAAVAGYGFGGTGAAGYDGITYPFGTLRVGENQCGAPPDKGHLICDFDDGTTGHDAPGGVGQSPVEEFIAPGGDASVAYNMAIVRSFVRATPEPKTMFLLGIALVFVSLLGDKRRQH